MDKVRILATADVHSPRFLPEFRGNLSAHEPPDLFLFAGDMINRGPKSLDTLRFLRDIDDSVEVVLGNHDRTATSMRSADFELVVRRAQIATGTVFCIHDPAKVPDPIPDGTVQILHGHCHGKDPRSWLPEHLHPLVMDCSLDALQSIAPVAWNSLID